jgi:hypothetical protein
MDKRKVITAYCHGFLTIQECAQILGIDAPHIIKMVHDPLMDDYKSINLTQTKASSI